MLSVIEKVNDVVNNFIWGVGRLCTDVCIAAVGRMDA